MTHLNITVKGIVKVPRMIWRYNGVLVVPIAKTASASFKALQSPIKDKENCGKLFSFSPRCRGKTIRMNKAPNPKITKEDRLPNDSTK